MSHMYHDTSDFSLMYEYYEVEVEPGVFARFKKNWLTRATYVFQANCAEAGLNTWNETGYGYGYWKKV